MSTNYNIVGKVWNFCNTLRDDGVSYGDYLEQLTYLLFLKMADEYSKPPFNRSVAIPHEYSWLSLTNKKSNKDLELHYSTVLQKLSLEKGILGQIFNKSQNKIQDPSKLSKLITLIDKEKWVSNITTDIKGEIYEGLLERNAEDTKSGAGQYFTPRALIRAIVKCVSPKPHKTVADPACGTGGFFLAVQDYLKENFRLDSNQTKFLKHNTFFGNEIVHSTRRLTLMNLFLHDIGDIESEDFISPEDALIKDTGFRADYVLANPPFGKKSSQTFTNESGAQEKDLLYNRKDFWATTSNKQLNFIQHINTMLKPNGKAAVVVPDNVLFEGGAGEIIRKELLKSTELHTILRLPTGIFYANAVKANVIFFDKKVRNRKPLTKEIWFYDYRTNIHHTLKKNPLKSEDLNEFISCYSSQNRSKRQETFDIELNPNGRWRKFTYAEIIARDKANLDITWVKDASKIDFENLSDPNTLIKEIISNLEEGLSSLRAVADRFSDH